jgi:iron(III) transport system ATP-binding protein
VEQAVQREGRAEVTDGRDGDVALRLEGIGKRFDRFVALRSIDLEVPRGEFVCFLGPSGCGKTTLLRVIAGLEEASEGRILQNGRDISRLPPSQRDYGIVFQSYALFPNLDVAANVGYGLISRRAEREQVRARVTELLALVGLPGTERKYPSQLSGGQQQRIALARALATRPGLLLLDEPLSALDANERVRLRGEIRRLQQQLGITTIMVTHDQDEALSIADRIVVMDYGRIEQVGTPNDVYERPATPFVAQFVGKVNVVDAVWLGDTRYRVGQHELRGEQAPDAAYFQRATGRAPLAGDPVRLYLRPEDHAVQPADGTANRLAARVTKLDFHGAHCFASMEVEQLQRSIEVYLSFNQYRDLAIGEGTVVGVSVRPDRIRAFPAVQS